MLLNWTAMPDCFFLYCPQYCEHTPPPTKANIFSSSSEQWNTSDSYFDNVVWKEGKKWVGGLCDNVVSSARAPFSFLPWSLFSLLVVRCPSMRWYLRQPPFVCFCLSSFSFLRSSSWNDLLLFPLCINDELHVYWECKIKSSTFIFLDQRLVKKSNNLQPLYILFK